MSRALSAMSLAAMAKAESPETYIVLVTITPAGTTDKYRFASMYKERLSETDDGEIYGVSSRGNDYTFVGFRAKLPTDGDATATATIEMPYTDEAAILLRSLGEAPSVLIEAVLYSDPDTVEVTYSRLYISSCSGSRDTLSMQLTRKSFANEAWPQQRYTPANAPGMF